MQYQEKNELGLILFLKILPREESFSCEDLFVDIDVAMTPVYLENLNHLPDHVDSEDLNLFLYDTFSELEVQRKNKFSIAGERYFQQWSEVTQKLIDYLQKGYMFTVQVKNITRQYPKTSVEVLDPEKLKAEIEAYDAERSQKLQGNHEKIEYFVEDNRGQACAARIAPNCEKIDICNLDNDGFEEGSDLKLYAKNIPIPELQQKHALLQLKGGRVSNSQLQAAMMDGANISWEDSGDQLLPLSNSSIKKNAAQYNALNRALREKNIFLIQGPPGTGKTTVIRELIQQYETLHPRAKILVVSQANVAVDNALSGLVKTQAEHIVRCGKTEKISEDLQDTSLEKRYDEYVQRIQKRPVNTKLMEKWLEFVRPEQGIHPNIGELIIRDRMIVGATCVGLARKKIGLERLEFDLVIVDEAGKALPGEILIPVLRAKKLILIGDHKQLPPVINTALFDPDKIELENRQILKQELFDVSFFQRLYERTPEENRAMLETQYRMPAVIGTLVSELFYDGKLKNGAETKSREPLFGKGNLVFYDCTKDSDFREQKDNNSIVNKREAELVMELLLEMSQAIPGHRVAVITPYRGQNRILHEAWDKNRKQLEALDLAINTIDAFQGDEAEIVIYCTMNITVRQSRQSGVARATCPD